MAGADFDVIVVGGGPAGSATAWSLASAGVKVCVLERASFPREKVCGDFVEPAGLRILERLGALDSLAHEARAPVTRNRVYFGPRLVYQGEIPYYESAADLRPHGLIIPRDELDTVLLARAEAASAVVRQNCAVTAVEREDGLMRVSIEDGGKTGGLRAFLVIGADGVESVVARSGGLRQTDRRHISVSRRAYVEGIEADAAEATVWFDEDIYPGYGWMFPLGGGRANLGVGVLSEAVDRFGLSVPAMFDEAVARLAIRHPGCRRAKVASRPIGGVVKMYGGVGRNHFDGALLVGDAGGFVDPMTGEGITQGMESGLIAARTALAALQEGRFDAAFLARFDRDFRAYFDPPMRYLEFCATLLRNRHFRDFWLSATRRGFERAQRDPSFGRVPGAGFGGLNLLPQAAALRLWSAIVEHLAQNGLGAASALATGRLPDAMAGLADLAAWERGWRASMADDPRWHFAWLADLVSALARALPSLAGAENPRALGPFAAAQCAGDMDGRTA